MTEEVYNCCSSSISFEYSTQNYTYQTHDHLLPRRHLWLNSGLHESTETGRVSCCKFNVKLNICIVTYLLHNLIIKVYCWNGSNVKLLFSKCKEQRRENSIHISPIFTVAVSLHASWYKLNALHLYSPLCCVVTHGI